MSREEVEKLLGRPVLQTFPNDYAGVHKAVMAGKSVSPDSELGRQCAALAHSLAAHSVPKETPRRRFVEYFSISPASYGFLSRK